MTAHVLAAAIKSSQEHTLKGVVGNTFQLYFQNRHRIAMLINVEDKFESLRRLLKKPGGGGKERGASHSYTSLQSDSQEQVSLHIITSALSSVTPSLSTSKNTFQFSIELRPTRCLIDQSSPLMASFPLFFAFLFFTVLVACCQALQNLTPNHVFMKRASGGPSLDAVKAWKVKRNTLTDFSNQKRNAGTQSLVRREAKGKPF
ncbi:hypothetical protein O181_021698 [Austropuccinia psidii MF-1]|uniref:Uncharacterized protein n=1 Tax=Austropuccinia psidii MF-1 TaxID=1389203 RepID=A0A9Q3CDU4_9BASI|nr:hypothetical protein [Austropuccinia psidii MF-1]